MSQVVASFFKHIYNPGGYMQRERNLLKSFRDMLQKEEVMLVQRCNEFQRYAPE